MMAQNRGSTRDSIPRPRIQTLSDMIFGLALSIGAATQLNQKPGNVFAIAYSLLSFGFAFLILALVWFRYSRIMSVLPLESGRVVAANMILLFFVSAEPYLYNLMVNSSYSPPPGQLNSSVTTSLYALDLGALMLILAYFIHELTIEERRLIPKAMTRGYRLTMYTTVISASMFLVSALPIFWSVVVTLSPVITLRYVMWNGVWVANWGRRLDEWMTGRKSKPVTLSSFGAELDGLVKSHQLPFHRMRLQSGRS
jgi:uncharacterized membrane protein